MTKQGLAGLFMPRRASPQRRSLHYLAFYAKDALNRCRIQKLFIFYPS